MIRLQKLKTSISMILLISALSACSAGESALSKDAQTAGQLTTGISTASGEPGTGLVNSADSQLQTGSSPLGFKLNNRYENPLFNLVGELPDIFVIYSNEELGQNALDENTLKSALSTGGVNYVDLVAQDSLTSENIQITITGIAAMTEKGRTVEEWLKSAGDSFAVSLMDEGAYDVNVQILPIQFLGETVDAVDLTCTYQNKSIHQQFVYLVSGDYCMLIAVSATEREPAALWAFFQKLA